jgi:hypothetical protein
MRWAPPGIRKSVERVSTRTVTMAGVNAAPVTDAHENRISVGLQREHDVHLNPKLFSSSQSVAREIAKHRPGRFHWHPRYKYVAVAQQHQRSTPLQTPAGERGPLQVLAPNYHSAAAVRLSSGLDLTLRWTKPLFDAVRHAFV